MYFSLLNIKKIKWPLNLVIMSFVFIWVRRNRGKGRGSLLLSISRFKINDWRNSHQPDLMESFSKQLASDTAAARRNVSMQCESM